MKTLEYYFKKAKKEQWAIGQFNFSDFTQVKGVIASAEKSKSPLILGTSEGESAFFGLEEAVALRDVLRKKTKLPIFLNLDHGRSFEYLKKAINAGYDMVHFDGSKLSFEENVRITKKVVAYARPKGVLVEGEMGKLGTESSQLYSEKFEIKEENLTTPQQAKEYADKTKVDLLAISIGNFHGIEISGICPNLRLDLLKKIKEEVTAYLVLHGGSGTAKDDIKKAIKIGISKININTEIRLAFSGNLRKALSADQEQVVPYKYLPKAMEAVSHLVDAKMSLFGSAGRF